MDLRISKKVAGFAASAIIASALVAPAAALADDGYHPMDSDHVPGAQVPSASVATGAACRAAMPSLEILGLNSIEETGTFSYLVNGVPQYVWEQPKYILAASMYNRTPSPYLANLATGNTPAALVNTSRAGGGAGPNAALDITPTSESHTQDPTDMAVLAMNPNVIVGNANGSVSYMDALNYDYEPGVNYDATDFAALANSMYDIAGVAQNRNVVATDPVTDEPIEYDGAGLTGRYGDPLDIADEYARYIDNLTAYVADNIQSPRTVVLINGVSGSGTTADPHVYSLLSYEGSGAGDGTASQNRYLETVQSVALNYADENLVNDEPLASLTSAQLTSLVTAQTPGIDLIMVGGQQNSSQNDAIVQALFDDGLGAYTYYVLGNGSHGSQYGTVMNSVENAQNVGRILGCLYADVFADAGIDQADLVAFYYNHFYHIYENDLGTVIGGDRLDENNNRCYWNSAMDGVRNWAADDISTPEDAAQWDRDTYNLSAVDAIVNPATASE